MTPEQFCYWLNGIFEIQSANYDKNEKIVVRLTEAQIDMIAEHLRSVFVPRVVTPQETWQLPPLPPTPAPPGQTEFIC